MLKTVHHPEYDANTVADDHRFPMRKYTELARYLQSVGLVSSVNPFLEPEPAGFNDLCAAHDEAYVRGCFDLTLDRKAQRLIGFELTDAVVRRSRLSCGGSVLAGRLALESGMAFNAAGGSHHARRSGGAGFCVFNDVGVAIHSLRSDGSIRRAMVIDCDVHQGDGTADIFAGDPNVFTVSVHCEENWPVRKIPSDLDVGLEKGLTDGPYLEALDGAVRHAFERFTPDIVFYNAGVDPHVDDRLGKLSLTDNGIMARDLYVLRSVRSRNIAVVGVIGGGYSGDVCHLARLHGALFHAGSEIVT